MSRIGAKSTLSCLLAFAILIGGCAQQAASHPEAAVPGGTVAQRLLGVWTTLDPQITGVADNQQIEIGLYDTLVALVDGKVVPYLATSWIQTPTSVKFNLRRDATCSDGAPMTATVVANSLKRLLITNSKRSATLVRGFGDGPYVVTADDAAATVSVAIGQPNSGLLYAFTIGAGDVVCPRGIANPDSLATTPAGSGPFTLESTVAGDSVTLVARPEWRWGPEGLSTRSPGFPQKMIYKVVANDTTAANLLVTGGVDVAVITGPDNARLAAGAALIRKTKHSYMGTDILFNESEGRPAADQTVRQALATAIEPAAFGKAAYYSSTPTTSFLAPDANCFDPSTKALMPKPDVVKAKQMMIAAGYPIGSDGKFRDRSGRQLTIKVAGQLSQNNGPDYLAAQFTAAGFDVILSKTERGTYATAYLSGNFDVAISEGRSVNPDPNGAGLVGLFTGTPIPAGSNASFKDYPTIDAEIAAANASTGAESCRHWAAVQRELLQRLVILPTVVVNYDWYGRGVQFLGGLGPEFVDPIYLRRVR